MNKIVISVILLIGLGCQVHAQSGDRGISGDLDQPYAGSYLIIPNNDKFLAPAIYRSQDKAERLTNPTAVTKICPDDFKTTIRLRELVKAREERIAPGIDSQDSNAIAANAAVGYKNIGFEVGGSYSNGIRLIAKSLKIISANTNDTAGIVLKNISHNCKEIIKGHLDQKRIVFIADEAVQADSFELTVRDTKTADTKVDCGFFLWFCKEIKLGGKIIHQAKRSSQNYVTIALTPAEVRPGQPLIAADDLNRSRLHTYAYASQ